MRLLYRSALALAFTAAMVSCGKSSSTTPSGDTGAGTTQSTTVAVSIPFSDAYGLTNFNPNSVNVTVGGSVEFDNSDGIEHHPVADDGSWNIDLGPGGTGNQKFATAGTYSYHCSIHPAMSGQIVVK
jgi:plastocyanin